MCGSCGSARATRRPTRDLEGLDPRVGLVGAREQHARPDLVLADVLAVRRDHRVEPEVLLHLHDRAHRVVDPQLEHVHNDLSGRRSFLIIGSPSQQWIGTRSGVPRSKAMRVRSAVFTSFTFALHDRTSGRRLVEMCKRLGAGLVAEGRRHLAASLGPRVPDRAPRTASRSRTDRVGRPSRWGTAAEASPSRLSPVRLKSHHAVLTLPIVAD